MAGRAKLLRSTNVAALTLVTVFLQACGGGDGGTISPPPPPPADTTAPSVSFNPIALTVESGQTGTSTLTATDNVGVTTGPTVECTNGGSFSGSIFTSPNVTAMTTSICTATASDAAGNSGSATLTVTIPQPQSAPEASAKSNLSLVSEGQPFVLDASDSSDANGDDLTYSWRQVSGSSVALNDETTVLQALTAPLVDDDDTLIFEVTVSDGIDSSTANISLVVDNISSSEATPNPSSFYGGEMDLISLTAGENDGHIAHWRANGRDFSGSAATSSQAFSNSGEQIGGQLDGELLAAGTQSLGFIQGIVQAGNALYYITTFFDTRSTSGNSIESDAVREGPVIGTVMGYGDTVFTETNRSNFFQSQDFTSIGQNQLVFVSNSKNSADEYDITTAIVEVDGSSVKTEITGFSSNLKLGINVASYSNNEYAVLWSENRADQTGSDIFMQRVTSAGVLLGNKTIVSLAGSTDNTSPYVTVMLDGNIFVVWNDRTSGVPVVTGKIFRPDGTLLKDAFEINRAAEGADVKPHVVALKTNHAVVIWPFRQGVNFRRDVNAQIFDGEGNSIGNEFVLEAGEAARTLEINASLVSQDNKVTLAWQSTPRGNSGIRTNRVVEFYPVGIE